MCLCLCVRVCVCVWLKVFVDVACDVLCDNVRLVHLFLRVVSCVGGMFCNDLVYVCVIRL